MRIITVTFVAKPDKIAAFRELAITHAKATATEPGCRQFDASVDPANPARFFFYEVYDDDAAFAAHKETAHFKANAPRFADWASSRERSDFVMLPVSRPNR